MGNPIERTPDGRERIAVAFDTPLGWMAMVVRGEVVQGITFGHPSRTSAAVAVERIVLGDSGRINLASVPVELIPHGSAGDWVERLRRYADGEPVDFSDVQIDIDGAHRTRFGRRIVAACRRIGWGQVRTYGELATECGSPGAARAVGQVMARNRFPLVVPCHRVVGRGGSLGGFSAPEGLPMKRRLLAMEGRQVGSNR